MKLSSNQMAVGGLIFLAILLVVVPLAETRLVLMVLAGVIAGGIFLHKWWKKTHLKKKLRFLPAVFGIMLGALFIETICLLFLIPILSLRWTESGATTSYTHVHVSNQHIGRGKMLSDGMIISISPDEESQLFILPSGYVTQFFPIGGSVGVVKYQPTGKYTVVWSERGGWDDNIGALNAIQFLGIEPQAPVLIHVSVSRQ